MKLRECANTIFSVSIIAVLHLIVKAKGLDCLRLLCYIQPMEVREK